MCYYHRHACLLVCLSLLSQRWNFSSKVVGKITAEVEAKKTFASAVPQQSFCQRN